MPVAKSNPAKTVKRSANVTPPLEIRFRTGPSIGADGCASGKAPDWIKKQLVAVSVAPRRQILKAHQATPCDCLLQFSYKAGQRRFFRVIVSAAFASAADMPSNRAESDPT